MGSNHRQNQDRPLAFFEVQQKYVNTTLDNLNNIRCLILNSYGFVAQLNTLHKNQSIMIFLYRSIENQSLLVYALEHHVVFNNKLFPFVTKNAVAEDQINM